MPIYEYECQACGHRVELIQKHTDAPLAECPKCHGAVKKLIAAPALQFKGSGWYITDYSSKGKEKSDAPLEKKSGDATPASAPAAATPTTAPEKKSDGGGGAATPPPKSEGTGAA